MPFCTNCGNEIARGTKFCPACGNKIEFTEAPVTEAITPAQPVAEEETHVYIAPEESTSEPIEAQDFTQDLMHATENKAPEDLSAPADEPASPVATPEATAPVFTPSAQYIPVPPVTPEPLPKKFNIFGLIGLILSALSLILCWLSFINLIFLIPAIVFVIIGLVKSKTCKKGLAVAGTVVCAVALILTIIISVAYVGLIADTGSDYDYNYDYNSDSDYDFNLYSNKLEDAYDLYCDYSYADIAYDGSYLSIDTNPYDLDDEFDTDAWEAIQDVNDYLGIPDSTEALMKTTRALDGRQEKTHGDVTVSWTYHPDSGLEVIYTID